MKIDHKIIIESGAYDSAVERLQILIEVALHRGRKILHTSITGDSNRFYACIIWQEEEVTA
jgi:hypothetical protein